MDLRATPNLVHLNDTGSGRRMLHLEPALGHRVVALSGSVWITQAGSPEDYVLRAGESLTLDSPGMAVVTSFGPADVEVVAPTDANAQPWPPAISATVSSSFIAMRPNVSRMSFAASSGSGLPFGPSGFT